MPGGCVEVGKMSVWASARRIALAIGVSAVALACVPDRSPESLVGTWYSEDARFDGRTLEIDPEWIRFMQGQRELGAVRVRSVKQEGGGEGPIRFEIAGTDREGQDTTLSLEMLRRPTELLRLETQAEPWRRTPRGVSAGVQPVPWGSVPKAPDPGGPT
jgi:hypothetical protein